MQACLGQVLFPERQDFTALTGQAGEQVNGIYETYAAFQRLLIGTWRRDELAAREAAE